MNKSITILVIAVLYSASVPVCAQVDLAVPFLLITPSAPANGMGEAAVAVATNDPAAFLSNPAQLGMQSRSTGIAFGHSFTNWLPAFGLKDVWLRTIAVTAGMNLRDLNEQALPISIGAGYSRMTLNLGTYIQTSSEKPGEVGMFDAYEYADHASIGVSIDYGVRVSVGATYKHVVSHIASIGVEDIVDRDPMKTSLFDYGMIVTVPALDLIQSLKGRRFEIVPGLVPFADVNIGFSKANMGKDVVKYNANEPASRLPRYAQAAFATELGLRFRSGEAAWTPLSFKWTIESGQELGMMNGQYKSGFGDLKFFDEVILGHINKETVMRKGWQCRVFELVSVRSGRFEEDPKRGNRRLTTYGWGVESGGIGRILASIGRPVRGNGIGALLLNHVNLSYHRSELFPDDRNSPLARTKFDTVNLSLTY